MPSGRHILRVSADTGRVETRLFADLPAMICWGMRDFVLDPSYLERWIRFWPHAEVHRLSDCGHYVLEDANAEIGLLVEEFLDKHPIGADRPPASRA